MNIGALFWFRRDLRLDDNHGLKQALSKFKNVQPIFIFDKNILDELPKNDARVNFIHETLKSIHEQLIKFGSSLKIIYSTPEQFYSNIKKEYPDLKAVYTNEDYEPYAISRDQEVESLLKEDGVEFLTFKDQVIFAKDEVLKNDGDPYTVYTPYKNKWLEHFRKTEVVDYNIDQLTDHFSTSKFTFPDLSEIGFEESDIKVKPIHHDYINDYGEHRNFPAESRTTLAAPHLRFGTISVRKLVKEADAINEVYLSELIWREFFMQILYHFPKVVDHSFREKYDRIKWRNNKEEFEKWKNGQTGFPIVDAGMRELNQTGYMHNRVRMICASFLTKDLLIDWRWGESYFAEKLLDYDLSANNGNWQWAAGTGCDAAPYFRVFNPTEQAKKFDKDLKYIHKWVTDLNELSYPSPMVDHKEARLRALVVYKEGIK